MEKAIKDLSGRGKKRTIGNEGRSFIIKTACTKPSDLGYPHEIWTNRLLTKYIRENAPEEYNLGNISNGTVSRILRDCHEITMATYDPLVELYNSTHHGIHFSEC